MKKTVYEFCEMVKKNICISCTFKCLYHKCRKSIFEKWKIGLWKILLVSKKSPNIKIPAAINESLLEEYTADEIYESILSSFVHELTHYYQWVKGIEQANAVSERQANFYRYRIIDEYCLQK